MKRKTQQTVAAFILTAIVIFAFCGFIAVDMTTDRYLPGQSQRFFKVSSFEAQTLHFSLLGEEYLLDLTRLDPLREAIRAYSGLLPGEITIIGQLTVEGYRAIKMHFDAQGEYGEIW